MGILKRLLRLELVLFPIVAAMSHGGPAPGSLKGPVDCMAHEHSEVTALVKSLRGLSNDFTPPADACNTYRALFAGMRDLAANLHQDSQRENGLLFPAALRMAEQYLR